MKKLRRLLGVALATLVIAFNVPIASAALYQTTDPWWCDATWWSVCLYEDGIGSGTDILVVSQNVSSLQSVGHTLPGGCNGLWNFGNGSSWNDCASAIEYNLPAGKKLCLYYDPNWSNLAWSDYNSPSQPTKYRAFNAGQGQFANDSLSSVKFVLYNQSC